MEQVTDGKGRTDEVIDAALDEVIATINTQADTLRRIRKRLAAGKVGKDATPATRHDAASAKELATAVAGADEGWRKLLVAPPTFRIIYTPDSKWFYCDARGWQRSTCGGTADPLAGASDKQKHYIDTCPPPPNLADWWQPEAAKPGHKWGCKVEEARDGWWLVTDSTDTYWLAEALTWTKYPEPPQMWSAGTIRSEAKALALLARATTPPPTYMAPPVDDAATERAAVLAKIPSRYVMPDATLADAVGNLARACESALRERDEWQRRALAAEDSPRVVRDWIAGKVN